MDSHGFLLNLLVYLAAAVIAVPLFARFGLSSVLGYLVAGIAIGPWGLGLISNVEDILHFAEFGVVLLLFIIGLELEPRKLWNMRWPILGTGGVQVAVTATAITLLATWTGIRWETALVIGLGLALSSTAIALQTLKERNLLGTPAGRTGFAVLLFQDVAVIPIIALVPFLSYEMTGFADKGEGFSLLVILTVIVAIFVLGRYLLHHIFRFVASSYVREVFTALSLLLVVGISLLMDMLGVSMALGAFLAGVLLADSQYRHALESDIEPFKGLLMGLFFISVGMSVDFGLLLEMPLRILAITTALVLLKAAFLFSISLFAGIPPIQRPFFTFLLCQGGEFGFVIFAFAESAGAMDEALGDQLVLVVAISMMVTPLLMVLNDRVLAPRLSRRDDRPMDDIADEGNPVIIVGFGRFGQVVGRLLMANGITPTLIDYDPDQVELVRGYGYKSYYGDALRADVLRAAGAERARLIVLTMRDPKLVNHAIELIRSEFPHLKIFTRAFDRGHAMHLVDTGVDGFARETFYSALNLGKQALEEFGYSQREASRLARKLLQFDLDMLHEQARVRHDEKALMSIAKAARENMIATFEADRAAEDSQQDLQDPDHP